MSWFKMSIIAWLIFALIRFIGGSIIDPEWSSSNNVLELVKSMWGFTMIVKPLVGTIYQAAVVTLTLAFIQHCGGLVLTHLQDIFTIGFCTILAPLIIPYIVYGEITLDQYLTGLDESFGFALIVTLFYAIADFFKTLTVENTKNLNNSTSTETSVTTTGVGTTTNRAGGDRLNNNVPRPSTHVQSPKPSVVRKADKLREFTFYTFLVSLPLILFYEVCLDGAEVKKIGTFEELTII